MNPNSVSNPEPWEPNQGLHLPLPPVKSRRNERRNEEYQQAKAEAAMISQGLAPS
jgi:hypothetical protein